MKISPEVNNILDFALEEAMRTGCYGIGPDHFFLGLLRDGDNEAFARLKKFGIDTEAAKEDVEDTIFQAQGIPYGHEDSVYLSREGENLMSLSFAEALKSGEDELTSLHLMRALLREDHCEACSYLRRSGLKADQFLGQKKESKPAVAPTPIDYSVLFSFANSEITS